MSKKQQNEVKLDKLLLDKKKQVRPAIKQNLQINIETTQKLTQYHDQTSKKNRCGRQLTRTVKPILKHPKH